MSNYGLAATALAAARLQPYQGDAGDGGANLTGMIAAELDVAASRLRGKFRCIRDYAALSAADQATFDMAVGLATAITLLMLSAAAASDGLAKLKSDTSEYTFLLPSEDEQERWTEEMTDAITQLSCVQNARVTQSQSINVINVNGRTRMREAAGRFTLSRMIAALLPAGWGGDRPSYIAPPGVDITCP